MKIGVGNAGAGTHCPARSSCSAILLLGVALLGALPVTAVSAQGPTLRELRRISAAPSDLSMVATSTVAPDGVIWIYQPEDGRIVGFAPGTSTPQVVGRSGEGPGDLRDATQMFARSGDLWIVDWRLQRRTLFDASGRVRSTVRIPRPEGLTLPRLQAASPAGATWWRSTEPDGSTTYSVVSTKGGRPRTVLGWPMPSCSVQRRTQNGSVAIFVPFCPRLRIAFAPNGEFAAEAVPLMLVNGDGGLQVVAVSAVGDTVLNTRLPLEASPIPDAVRDSAIDFRLGGARGVTRELYQEMVDRELVPRLYSPVVDLRVSDAGDVVIDVVAGPRAKRQLVVLRRGSSDVSMLPMRTNQSLRWFGGNRLLVAEEDEDGLQDVVLYEIVGN